MKNFNPLRELPQPSQWSSKDVMVIFGELFQRGYANGIVDMAKEIGMRVIYSTVGRRDSDNQLRALTEQELSEKDQPLVNIPLEAGFDLYPDENGQTPVDQLKNIKMNDWDKVQFDWKSIKNSQARASENFKSRVREYVQTIEKMIPEDANVLFVHTMAGGFPRAKVVMPVTNKVFKGYDDRFCSSEYFWKSDIGKFCDLNFKEVTGETLQHLIELTTKLREKKQREGKNVAYVAYGYHGTDVLHHDKYYWQSYSPYLQGWAKLHLEDISKKYHAAGVNTSVYNAPEILTNSSSIFLGVEVSLYPLIGALAKEGRSNPHCQNIIKKCEELLKSEHSIQDLLDFCEHYLDSEIIKKWTQFDSWPQHNGNEQMKLMRESSANLIQMHKNEKELITSLLSEVVFKACGALMFHNSWKAKDPVYWIGHDIVAKQTKVN